MEVDGTCEFEPSSFDPTLSCTPLELAEPCNRRWLAGDESKKHDLILKQKQSLNKKRKLLEEKFQKEDKVP